MGSTHRNWSAYNEHLVERGEFYVSPQFLDSWEEELAEMNRGKPGRPYTFPKSFVEFGAVCYTFLHLPYRQLEGFCRQLAEYLPVPEAADYTTLFRRIRELDLDSDAVLHTDEAVVAAVDSTGIKVTNRSEWLRKKHGTERRGWIKVHVAVAVDSGDLLSIEVTDERTTDAAVLPDLVEDLDLEDCLADAGYDTYESFETLEERGLDPPGIKTRSNASTEGLSARAFAAREQQDEAWKETHEYGQRWQVEALYSAVKRTFGETVRATSVEGAFEEVRRKFLLYDLVRQL